MRKDRKQQIETITRQGVHEAVVRLLARQGADGLTMEKVAAEAGMAKGTLYGYFRNKRQLLDSVKEASLKPLREELLLLLDDPAIAPDEKIRRFIHRHLGYFDANRDVFRVLLWERNLGVSRAGRHRSVRYRTYIEKLAAVLRGGSDAGSFRPLDATKLAIVLFEADIAIIGSRLEQEGSAPVEDDARFLYEVVMHGISNQPTQPARRA